VRASIRVAVPLFLLLLASGASAAELPSPLPSGTWLPGLDPARLEDARPGSWVEYRLMLDGRPVGGYLRYVYAGRDGGGILLELWVSSRPGSGAMAFRLRLERLPDGRYRIDWIRQRLLGGEILEVPMDAGEAEVPDLSTAVEGEFGWTRTTVMTGAGALPARMVELRRHGHPGLRIWFADSVPIFGIARLEQPGGAGWELHACGEGGRLLFDAGDTASDSRR